MSEYIKELAPRTDTGLKLIVEPSGDIEAFCSISPNHALTRVTTYDSAKKLEFYVGTHVKPIYRSISDLTKPIKHNGEEFVPWDRLSELAYQRLVESPTDISDIVQFHGYDFPTWQYLQLLEWHFDINGWIEQGKAIDVNTLEVNCYE